MKIVQINATCGKGSTGKICVDISKLLTQKRIENYILYSSGETSYPLGIKCSEGRYLKTQALKSRLFGNWGFNSVKATQRILRELDRINPDIVHLHNIHGHDCDLTSLFNYFKKNKTRLIWTFHDCWAFTGYCPHFTMARCDKWKTHCGDCPQKRGVTWLFDRSGDLFDRKSQLFSELDMTIVSPSQWLSSLVKQSHLKNYPVKVINNGIDLSVFRPTESDFRDENALSGKYIVLGVAFDWGKRKGLDAFVELSKRLDSRYQIVLVGTDDSVDKQLPDSIISIHRTQNQQELAAIYAASDVFVQTTREENYPTVNMEALACGTPVVTFRTGGSPEMLDETCGSVVQCDDIDALEAEIKRVCETKPSSSEACLKRARGFDMNDKFAEYVKLYQEVKT